MKPTSNKHLKEVEEKFKNLNLKANNEKSEKLKKYIGTNLNVLGISSNSQVEIQKKGFSFFHNETENIFLIFDTIYRHSKIFEVKNQAFIFLNKHHKHISLNTLLNTLPNWVNYIDNWSHSDNLSKYLTKLIEDKNTRETMYSIIRKWNTSDNLWERRQSLISLFYYAKTKKEYVPFEFAKEIVFPLFNDKEYFVQKAVGWTLRESYNVYPKQTYNFISKNIYNISPIAFTTCIEKMTMQEKHVLKLKRKK